jgi:hypothetical protein
MPSALDLFLSMNREKESRWMQKKLFRLVDRL